MAHRVVEPGVIEIIYESAEDMAPDGQDSLRGLIEEQLQDGPLALVFLVRKVASVDASVPMYWLDLTAKHAPRLCAMGIASKSMAVRAATRTFSVANVLRRVHVAVHAFPEETAALDWAREQLYQARSAA